MIIRVFTLLFFSSILQIVRCDDEIKVKETEAEQRLRHKKNLLMGNKGKYTTKEEIQKPPSEDHPCRLTRTSVEITFPDMKSETFISFLGYKEPNLIHLMRCKGMCESDADRIECAPVKVHQKLVKMTVKTQFAGREPREKMKDMVLEEHVECGCQCKHISSLSCLGQFNNRTCECECDDRLYSNDRLRCEMRKNTYWDTTACQCRSKSVAPRGVDQYPGVECRDGYVDHPLINSDLVNNSPTRVEIVSLILLGCFFTVSLFFAASTFYYRKKVNRLVTSHSRKENDCSRSKPRKPTSQSKPAKPSKPVLIPIMTHEPFLEDIISPNDTFERYNEHGVRIDEDYFED